LLSAMDIYISALVMGAAGMLFMALGGLGRHGRGGSSRAQGHGRTHASNAPSAARSAPARQAHVQTSSTRVHSRSRAAAHSAGSSLTHALLQLTSPRVLFSVLVGFGATGQFFGPMLSGWALPSAALAGGILFERFVVTPIWNLALKFASRPARTLENAITDEATAVTAFDANGEGIVSFEMDGQIVQVLARLRPGDRWPGLSVRVGQKLRIEDVNAARNTCTVSIL
jgi:hypothetical protein